VSETGDRRPRSDLLVVAIGNTLREDDGVGPYLLRRLGEALGPGLATLELGELDLSLAAELGPYRRLLVLDAADAGNGAPYRLAPLVCASDIAATRGFASHLFDWGLLLAVARDLFGHAPEAELLAVSGRDFGLGEGLSAECRAHAEAALVFLLDYCTG
jgi:hydrogenase maturation protease